MDKIFNKGGEENEVSQIGICLVDFIQLALVESRGAVPVRQEQPAEFLPGISEDMQPPSK